MYQNNMEFLELQPTKSEPLDHEAQAFDTVESFKGDSGTVCVMERDRFGKINGDLHFQYFNLE